MSKAPCENCSYAIGHGPDCDRVYTDRIAALEAELAEARLARVPLLEVKIHAIGELIADNGCDCECDHDFESHDDDCERCLACRISAALDEKGGG
jgi:hypothetical protein